MKTVLVLSALLCAAFAAPAENIEMAAEAAVEAPQEQTAAEPAPVFEDPQQEVAAPESRIFCPDGWFNHNSRCYLFVNTPMSWYNAEEHCNTFGGQLTSATNPREYSFLQQLTKTASQSSAWMGGFRLQTTWLWIDREGFYYTNWFSESTSTIHPCMYLSATHGWSNTMCTSTFPFICSKNLFGC